MRTPTPHRIRQPIHKVKLLKTSPRIDLHVTINISSLPTSPDEILHCELADETSLSDREIGFD
jgi:hypothetical protein